MVEDIVKAFHRYNADSVYGDLLYVDRGDTSIIRRYWKSGSFSRRKFLFGWMPPHPALFVRKRVIDQYGKYNLILKSAADYEWMLRLLYKYCVSTAYLPIITTKMRVGGQSNSSLSNRLKANWEDRIAWYVNGVSPLWFTTLLKPIRKIPQYWLRPR